MKRVEFSYKKKEEGDSKEYNVIVLNEDDKYITGISLDNLDDEKRESFIAIQKEYEEKIKPYVSIAYRKFLKEKVEETIKEEIIKA